MHELSLAPHAFSPEEAAAFALALLCSMEAVTCDLLKQMERWTGTEGICVCEFYVWENVGHYIGVNWLNVSKVHGKCMVS